MPQVGAFLLGMVGFGAPAIGAATFGAWTAGASFAVSAVGRLLISTAFSALSRAIAGAPDTPIVGVRTNSTMTGGANSDAFILGWYATEGQLVAPPMSHGWNDKTPNAWLTYVIELGAPGQTLDSVIIDGEPVPLDTTPEPGGAGYAVLGRIAGHAWVKYYDGTQTAADPFLIERYGSYERPWTAQHIGTGIAYAVVTFTFNREIFGGFPKVRFVVNGIPLYDPRKDSTAGGSGAQRWANRSTWAVSRNPMVMIYNILRGIELPGGHIWGGECEAEDLPFEPWASAMDKCDELHDGEPRYRAGFEVFAEDEPYSVIQELLTACGGQLAEMGGEWVPAVGAPDLPVMFITDDDLIVTEADDFAPFPSPEATYNGAAATFPRPSSVWEASEIEPIYFPTLEAEDGGRRLMAALQVNACPHPKQVRRVAREAVRDSRRWRRHSLALPPEAGVLQPLDTISWTSARNGYSAKLFEVAEIVRDPLGAMVALVLRERDPSDYDFAAETLPTPPSVVPVRPASQAVPGWSVLGVAITDASETARRPALQFGWTGDTAEDATGLRWEVRRAGTSTVILRGSTHDVEAGGLTIADGLLPATGYEARARFVIARRRSSWSSWLSAATPDVRLGPSDVAVDAITEDVTSALADLDEWSNVGLAEAATRYRSLLGELVALRDNVAELRAQDWTQSEQARTRLAVSTAQSIASVEQSLTVAVTDLAALSQYAVSLAAEVAGKAGADAVSSLTTRVDTAEGQIAAQSTAITDLTAAVGTKASAAAVTALDARVTDTENVNSTQATAITSLNASLAGKANASALTALEARVTDTEGDISSQATLLTTLETSVGNVSASGLFAVQVETTPSGALSRIGLKAKATSGESASSRTAAMFLEAVSGGTSRIVFNADSVAVLNGATRVPPFVVTGGQVYLGDIKIRSAEITGDMIVGGAVSATYPIARWSDLTVTATTEATSVAVGSNVVATFAAADDAVFPTNPVEVSHTLLIAPSSAAPGRVTFALQQLIGSTWSSWAVWSMYHQGATVQPAWRGLGGTGWGLTPLGSGTWRMRCWVPDGPSVTINRSVLTMRQLNK